MMAMAQTVLAMVVWMTVCCVPLRNLMDPGLSGWRDLRVDHDTADATD
jgi:hypothetical protein